MIRELPTTPEYWYVHNCPNCGCHNAKNIAKNTRYPYEPIKVCSWCGKGYTEMPREQRHKNRPIPRDQSLIEAEIEREILKARYGWQDEREKRIEISKSKDDYYGWP